MWEAWRRMFLVMRPIDEIFRGERETRLRGLGSVHHLLHVRFGEAVAAVPRTS
jgi:hypothetical protein